MEPYPGWVLIEYGPTDRFSRGSAVGSIRKCCVDRLSWHDKPGVSGAIGRLDW
jgi:hypothetical protein